MAARTMVFPLRAFLAAPLYQEGIDFPQSLSPKAKHRNSELSNYRIITSSRSHPPEANYRIIELSLPQKLLVFPGKTSVEYNF